MHIFMKTKKETRENSIDSDLAENRACPSFKSHKLAMITREFQKVKALVVDSRDAEVSYTSLHQGRIYCT